VTWVFDVSSNCAVDPWTVVFGNAPGDGRRLPACSPDVSICLPSQLYRGE
jgi:hypothetical protein